MTSSWLPSWDAAAYVANHGHHRRQDAWFLALADLHLGERVLDVGCGDGAFTRRMADLVAPAEVVGLDPQAGFLAHAGEVAGPNQRFVEATAQQLASALADEPPFDVVVSRSALQWVPEADHDTVLTGIHAVLAPGGRAVLELSGAGNIARLRALMDDEAVQHGGAPARWAFPDAGSYHDRCLDAGFEVGEGAVWTVAQRRPFTRDELAGWMSSQGFQAYDDELPADARQSFRDTCLARIDELADARGSYDQTFVRLVAQLRRAG